jgi:putative tricarboxylic transport membrane protein
MDAVVTAFAHAATWQVGLATLFGSLVGLVFGAIPGLTYSMALAMVLPLTFGMGNEAAIAVMLSTYIGGMTGGAISAILIGVPGTPSAAATVFDGHLLAKSNRASLAIGTATVAAGIGGIFSLIVMLVSVQVLAHVALAFGPAEITALVIFGLSTICGLAEKSLVRGLIGGVLGLMVMSIGQDPIDGIPRFTFGSVTMLQGVDLLVAMIGLFAVPHAITALITWKSGREAKVEARAVEVALPSIPLLLGHWANLLRSSLIGVVIGAIPGTGGPIAAFLAYDQAKRFHKHPERMGKGEGDLAGVIAPEAANHAVTGGAMIPLLGLGIPGDPATAIILGGLLIHGIQPGPLLFVEKPTVIANIYILFLFAYVVVVLLQLYGVRLFVQALRVPPHLLAVGILVMCAVGSFAIRNTLFDVVVMMLVGLGGYALIRARIPVAPILLGLVLGPTLERETRTALIMSEGHLSIFYTSPTALFFFALVVLVIGSHVVGTRRAKARAQGAAAQAAESRTEGVGG